MRGQILILAIGFLPNIGGLETHLKDLIDELVKKNWYVYVLTYQPLNTPVLGKWIEFAHNLKVFRLPVIQGIFYKLLKIPLFEFLFLEPLLFLCTPFILLKYPDIQVINAQGIIAGFSAAFWSRIFNRRYVVSAQSVYHFPKRGAYRKVCEWIFKSADKIVAISEQTKQDIQTLGVLSSKVVVYTNWENSDFFAPVDKKKAKEGVGFSNQFVVSFFGRLVEEKGIKTLLEAVDLCDKKITFAIYGEGPLLDLVLTASKENKNIIFMKTIPPDQLPLHYSAADIVIMPSLHEEGFGRVAAGALFCGTPVIASNRGALPQVVNDKVGKIFEPTPQEIARTINYFFNNRKALKRCASFTRKYATGKFNSKNVLDITSAFSSD